MISTIAAIAGGGALGAVTRHFANAGLMAVLKTGFPYGIMGVNILGSFLMGALIALFAAKWGASQEMKLFLTTGFLGGFTTFSAFSLDAMTLWSRGDVTGAALYVTGTVILSLAAIFLGSWLVWKFLT